MVAFVEVKRVAQEGVALSSCTLPAAGRPKSGIGDDAMGVCLGIHGEPGVRRGKLESADAIAATLTYAILADTPLATGDEVAISVHSPGAAPRVELDDVYRKVHRRLWDKGPRFDRPYVGEYAASPEMAGCSVSLLKVHAGLKGLLDAPAEMAFIRQG